MSNKLDEFMKLANPNVRLGMEALEEHGVPWRMAMGSTSDILEGLLNALGNIVILSPSLGTHMEEELPIKAAHDRFVAEVRAYVEMLTMMANIAEEAASDRAKGSPPDVTIPSIKPKVPSNQN